MSEWTLLKPARTGGAEVSWVAPIWRIALIAGTRIPETWCVRTGSGNREVKRPHLVKNPNLKGHGVGSALVCIPPLYCSLRCPLLTSPSSIASPYYPPSRYPTLITPLSLKFFSYHSPHRIYPLHQLHARDNGNLVADGRAEDIHRRTPHLIFQALGGRDFEVHVLA